MTAKAVCLRIKVAQLKSFGWKTTGILQYLEVFYIGPTLLKLKNKWIFFFLKKNIDAEV